MTPERAFAAGGRTEGMPVLSVMSFRARVRVKPEGVRQSRRFGPRLKLNETPRCG